MRRLQSSARWVVKGFFCFLLLAIATSNIRAESISTPTATPSNVQTRYSVGVNELTWYDQSRQRQIPSRVYFPRSHSGPFPVVIFSHGLGGSRSHFAYLGQHWASRGYVSVHLQHIGSDDTLWRGNLFAMRSLREAYELPSTGYHRPLDVRFVIDQLHLMQAAGVPLGQMLDLSRIGVAGNDFGAQAGLLLAGQKSHYIISDFHDPRVKAVVAMSPPVPSTRHSHAERFGSVQVPCMHITGTHDDGVVGSTRAYQRRIPFDHIHSADQYLVILNGSDHLVYMGHVWQRDQQYDAYYQSLIRTASTLFLDAHLKGDPRAKQQLATINARSLLRGGGWLEKKVSTAAFVSTP